MNLSINDKDDIENKDAVEVKNNIRIKLIDLGHSYLNKISNDKTKDESSFNNTTNMSGNNESISIISCLDNFINLLNN